MNIFPYRLLAGIAFAGTFMLASGLSAEGNAGVEGVISVSPSKPGPIRQGEESKAPAGNIEFIVKNGETRVASFTTDGEGKFRVSLPPGHYTVVRGDPGSRIGHWQFEVDVAGGQFSKVAWTGDSGMR